MLRTKVKDAQLPPGWSHGQHNERVDAIKLLPKRVRVLLASEWARSTLHVFESRYPIDNRPRLAVEAAEKYVVATAAADAADAAAYAAYAAADSAYAAYAANYAAYAANYAAIRGTKWQWMHAVYKHARGPIGLTFDPSWKTSTTVALAQGIYRERAHDRLPILADALQDAGCDCPELMIHLQDDAKEWTNAEWVLWNLMGFGD